MIVHRDLISSSHSTPFAGQVEIGRMAYDRHAALQVNVGLPTLCQTILRHQIDRDPEICLSPVWASVNLSSEFSAHAVLEVYVMWSLYATLNFIRLSEKVFSLTAAGTPVIMRAADG